MERTALHTSFALISVLAAAARAQEVPIRPSGGHLAVESSRTQEDPVFGSPLILPQPNQSPFPSSRGLWGFDVAYSAAANAFAVPFLHYDSVGFFGGGVSFEAGNLVGADGSLGPGFVFWSQSHLLACSQRAPRIASVVGAGAFVAVWVDESFTPPQLLAAAIDAKTGMVDTFVTVATRVINDDYAVTGGATEEDDEAIVVWYSSTGQTLSARRLQVTPQLGFTLGPVVPLASGSQISGDVGIARSGGTAGRHLVVYAVDRGAFTDIHGAIVDRALQILDQGPIVESDEVKTRPAVDGDGQQWVVAYEISGGGIASVPVFWNSALRTAWVGDVQPVHANPSAFPSVAWLSDSALVAYSAAGRARVASVDPFHCRTCEGNFALSQQQVRVASALAAGGSDGDLALLAIGRVSGQCVTLSTGTGTPTVQTYRAHDGTNVQLAGGCGSGGRARASCAVTGNQNFELGLWDAAADVPALLAISGGVTALPCGGCTLRPDLGLGFVLAAGNTDGLGNAALSAPLPDEPALVGVTLYQQWLVLAGAGCFGALELSSALAVTIE